MTGYERALGGILLMEMFCMLVVSLSVSQFGYGTIVFFFKILLINFFREGEEREKERERNINVCLRLMRVPPGPQSRHVP